MEAGVLCRVKPRPPSPPPPRRPVRAGPPSRWARIQVPAWLCQASGHPAPKPRFPPPPDGPRQVVASGCPPSSPRRSAPLHNPAAQPEITVPTTLSLCNRLPAVTYPLWVPASGSLPPTLGPQGQISYPEAPTPRKAPPPLWRSLPDGSMGCRWPLPASLLPLGWEIASACPLLAVGDEKAKGKGQRPRNPPSDGETLERGASPLLGRALGAAGRDRDC